MDAGLEGRVDILRAVARKEEEFLNNVVLVLLVVELFVAACLVIFKHSQENGHKLVPSQIGCITRFHGDVSFIKQENSIPPATLSVVRVFPTPGGPLGSMITPWPFP